MVKRPRIFLGVLDIANLFRTMAVGFRELGFEAHALNLGSATNDPDESRAMHPMLRFFRFSHRHFLAATERGAQRPRFYLWKIVYRSAQCGVLTWLILRFDIFVFHAGIGFTSNQLDFRLLKKFGKTLVFIYYGSSSRPPYLTGARATRFPADELMARTRKIKAHVDRVSPYADYIVDNPLSAHFQTRRCCMRQSIGNPVPSFQGKLPSQESNDERSENSAGNIIRILHAPSYPELKGTETIRKAIELFKTKGFKIDYVEISGKPNAVVLREIERCDFVIDELYSEMYGGVFSLEAASRGKPTIVCGYGGEELARFVPKEAALPSEYCTPEEFEHALERLLVDRAYRLERGRIAKEFTESWATPNRVANRLLRLATGNAPENWFFDPKTDIRYTHGAGGSIEKVRGAVRRILASGGKRSLLLDDKPELAERLVKFAEGVPEDNFKPKTATD